MECSLLCYDTCVILSCVCATSWQRYDLSPHSCAPVFIVRDHHGSTRQGFMILNRLNSENTQEDIYSGMEFRLQSPFVLFGKKSGECPWSCDSHMQLVIFVAP